MISDPNRLSVMSREPGPTPSAITTPTSPTVEPLLQAQWITDGLRVAEGLSSIYAVGWIHLYDEPPESYGGLLETDGVKKPGYAAWKTG
jgi:hypothetical protein